MVESPAPPDRHAVVHLPRGAQDRCRSHTGQAPAPDWSSCSWKSSRHLRERFRLVERPHRAARCTQRQSRCERRLRRDPRRTHPRAQRGGDLKVMQRSGRRLFGEQRADTRAARLRRRRCLPGPWLSKYRRSHRGAWAGVRLVIPARRPVQYKSASHASKSAVSLVCATYPARPCLDRVGPGRASRSIGHPGGVRSRTAEVGNRVGVVVGDFEGTATPPPKWWSGGGVASLKVEAMADRLALVPASVTVNNRSPFNIQY